MKDRVEPMIRAEGTAVPLSRQQHQITLDSINRDSQKERGSLSPLSPTLSEASSASSSSPVPNSRKYARKEKIGQGAQGSVYRCIEIATGMELAVKIILIRELSATEIESIKREVKTVKKLTHEHLVAYYKATEKKAKQLSIYMEYVAGGSLSSKLRQGGALELAATKKYTRQLCEALRYLHEYGIAHRDIKCANVFLTSAGDCIKLGDFGAFKEVGSVSLVGGLKGTPHWMAPEVIRAEQQTSEDRWFKADIWSLGCTVIEMLTGHSPWQQYSNPLTAMYQIVSSNMTPTIPADATEETTSFLSLCLRRNPDERASIQQLLKHPFVQQTAEEDMPTERPVTAEADPVALTQNNHDDRSENQPEATTPTVKLSVTKDNEPHDTSPMKPWPELRKPQPPKHEHSSSLHSPRPTRSIRKPSIVPRLIPLELIHSPSNQEKHHHPDHPHVPVPPTTASTASPRTIPRGVSTGVLSSMRGETTSSPHGTPMRAVRLRRLSTAPAPSRETEEILSCVPPTHKLKLPPLTARPTSSISTIERR